MKSSRFGIFAFILALCASQLLAQSDFYAGAAAGSSDNWNSASSVGQKWAAPSAPATYTSAVAGANYHLNGNTVRAGRIGTTAPAMPGSFAFTGERLLIDAYASASAQPANAAPGTLIVELSSASTGPRTSLSAVTWGTYTSDLQIGASALPIVPGYATATNTMRALQGSTGIINLAGTLAIQGDLQLKLPSSINDMLFNITAAVSGTGRMEAAGGSAGGATTNGFVTWQFSHLAGDNSTQGSGWQGASIQALNKHTIGFSADTDLYRTNPNAALYFSTSSAGFLNLSAGANLSVGSGKLVIPTYPLPTVLPNGIYTVALLNQIVPGLAAEGTYVTGDPAAAAPSLTTGVPNPAGTTSLIHVGSAIGTAMTTTAIPAIASTPFVAVPVGAPMANFQVVATNAPSRYAATNLPDGLTIDPVTGTISGTATTVGTTMATIYASNANGTGRSTLSVTAGLPLITAAPMAITPANVAMSSFNLSAKNTNSSTKWTASPLPAGLGLSATTGTSVNITGTPATAGVTHVVVTATNGAGTATTNLTLYVTGSGDAPAILGPMALAGAPGMPLYYQVEATNAPTAYSATGLPAGMDIDAATGLIAGSPTTTGVSSAIITATNAAGSGSATLTVAVGAPAITSETLVSVAVNTPLSYQITATNAPTSYAAFPLPAGLSIDPATGLISGTPTAAATMTTTVVAANAASAGTATLTITVAAAGPTITSPTTASGVVGLPFSYQISAAGVVTSYSAAPLPAGLSLDPRTGLITGTPTMAGVTEVSLGATDNTGTATGGVTITIAEGAPVITSPDTAYGSVGAPFSYQIAATGQPTSFAASPLPVGLTIDPTTGIISGTPAAAGTTSTVLTATNATGSGMATLSIAVNTASATHEVAGSGYTAGQTVTIANTLAYAGAATSLQWASLLPSGWSFVSASGAVGDVGPTIGQTGELDWTWTTPPAGPVSFTYTVRVPAGTTGVQQITALATVNSGGSPLQIVARPDPLALDDIQSTLVSAGQPQSVILTTPSPKGYVAMAAQELQKHLQLISGAVVPIDSVGHESSYPGKAFIYVGPSSATTAAGISTAGMSTEWYVIKTIGSNLYIVGVDSGTDNWTDLSNCQPGTMFGVYHLLGEVLGVRWLWPGDSGIVVPARSTVTVPALDIATGPAMVMRKFRTPRIGLYTGGATTFGSNGMSIPVLPASAAQRTSLANDDSLWLRRQRMGTRKKTSFAHSQTTWWGTYGTTHPEYFAVLLPGKSQPSPQPDEVKLNVSHSDVWTQIIDNWVAAGKPNNLNICPNDSRSHCVCPDCLAWDSPAQSPNIVFNDSSAQLGDRYARFYTEIANRVKALNPNATVYGYAYDVYRNAPYVATLPDNVALEYIPGAPSDVVPAQIEETQANVRGWIAHGCTQMYLRPNWFLAAHAGPFAPIHRAGDHFRAMLAGGYLLGMDCDSSASGYAGFGLYYYLFCRMMANPSLTPDQIITEYCSGFGSAAGPISDYFAYWEKFINQQADSNNTSILGWSDGMAAYPGAYTDAVFDGAEQILNAAAARLAPAETAARARIDFLRLACTHGRLTAHAIALVNPSKTLANNPAAEKAMRALLAFRDTYAGSFALWREWLIDRESYGVPGMNSYWSAILANPTPTAPEFVSAATASASTTTAFNFQLIATNTTTSYTATGLPGGLTINSATGLISGIPTATGTTVVTITATNALGATSSTLALSVTSAAPEITSALAASGATGTPFSYQITATNSPSFYAASPLPDGLNFDSTTGSISGTPTTAGRYEVELSAMNATGAGAATLTFTIAMAPPTITSATSAFGVVGNPFNYQIIATGSPTSYSASPLPPGLTVDAMTGLISGTPTAPGTTTITLGAVNSSGSGSGTLTLNVTALGDYYSGATAQAGDTWNTANSTAVKWAAAFAPTTYLPPRAGNAYHTNGYTIRAGRIGVNAPSAPGTLVFAGDTLVIDGYAAASGQTANTTPGTLILELASPANGPRTAPTTVTRGTYTADLRTAPLSVPVTLGTATAANTLRALQAGNGITTLEGALAIDGDTQLKLPSGVSDMLFTINANVTGTGRIELSGGSSGGSFVNGWVTWVFNAIAGDNVTPGSGWQGSSINVAHKHTLGFGHDANFYLTNPGAALAFAAGTGFLNLNANVSVGPGKFVVGTTTLANGVYTVSDLNARFPGLASEGSNAGGNLRTTGTTYKLYIGQPIQSPPEITSAASAHGVVGAPFAFRIEANGSPTAYAAAPLPDGLSVDPATGVISGVPTTPGTTTSVVTVTNVAGTTSSELTLTIAVPVAPPTITSAAAASGTTGMPFNFQVTAAGSPSDYSISALPDGLTLDSTTGIISGTPIVAGVVVGTLSVANEGGTSTQDLTITILPPAPVITSATSVAGMMGTAFSYQIVASADPVSFAATGLPPGVSLDAVHGLISGVPSAAGVYTANVSATNAGGTGSAPLIITVAKAVATVAIGTGAPPPVRYFYSGDPIAVPISTSPAGLSVLLTYNGSPTPPTLPGTYEVVAVINDPNFAGSATGTLQIDVTALLRHASVLNGEIDGSAQMLAGENVVLNGDALLSGDLLVPGTPEVRTNGRPTLAGIRDAFGATLPADYTVILNGASTARYIVRRVDAIPIPVLTPPEAPTGTRNVVLNGVSDPLGDAATIRNLTLNGSAGTVALPPGTYDTVTVNGSSRLVLGRPSSAEPLVYNLQRLILNGTGAIDVSGPVVLRLASDVTFNARIGGEEPGRSLTIEMTQGGVTLNGAAVVFAEVVAPNGSVTINANAILHGRVSADRLTISGNGVLEQAP